jgi:hypothetical protein
MKALLGLDIASGKSYIVMGAQTHMFLSLMLISRKEVLQALVVT